MQTKLPSALWRVCTDCNEFRVFRHRNLILKAQNVNFEGLFNFPLHQSTAYHKCLKLTSVLRST